MKLIVITKWLKKLNIEENQNFDFTSGNALLLPSNEPKQQLKSGNLQYD